MKYLSLIISFLFISACNTEKIPDKYEKVKIISTYHKPYGKYKKFEIEYTILSTNQSFIIKGRRCTTMKNIIVGEYYIGNVSEEGCSFVESLNKI